MPATTLCSRCNHEPAGPLGVCAPCLGPAVEADVQRGRLERFVRDAIVLALVNFSPAPLGFAVQLGLSFWENFCRRAPADRARLIGAAAAPDAPGELAASLGPELAAGPGLEPEAAEQLVERLVGAVAACPADADPATVETVLRERLLPEGSRLCLPPTRVQPVSTRLLGRRARRVEPAVALPGVPGYRVLDVLGRGGQGTVLLVLREETGAHCALKLRPWSARAAQANEVSRKLEKHPQVIEWVDDGELLDGGRWSYVVQRPVCAGTVRQAIDQGLDRETALCFAGQMLEGLASVHGQNVVHRDLKPSNLLLQFVGREEEGLFGSDLRLRITDLGLARDLARTRLTRTGAGGGWTHLYFSPEHIRAEDGTSVGFASDIWCCGLVIHELLTGSLPYKRSWSEWRLCMHLTPSEWKYTPPEDLPAPLQSFLRDCLHIDPDKRWRSGQEALEAFREAGGDLLARLRHERYRAGWKEVLERGLLRDFLRDRDGVLGEDAATDCARALAAAGVEAFDARRLPGLLEGLAPAVRAGLAKQAVARRLDEALRDAVAGLPEDPGGADWSALGAQLMKGGEAIAARRAEADRVQQEAAEELLAPLGADWAGSERPARRPRAQRPLPGLEARERWWSPAPEQRAEAARCGWPVAVRNTREMDFALIPAGSFRMGSPEAEPGRDSDEELHNVTLTRRFYLKATPVTQGEFAGLMGYNPSWFKGAGLEAPVEMVSWFDAVAFCNALSEAEGLVPAYVLDEVEKDEGGSITAATVRFHGLHSPGYRLPSEAEWEYACRAGTASALYTGALTIRGERDGPELDPIAWYGGNSGVRYEGAVDSSDWKEKQHAHERAGTHAVGQKLPNGWGLFDMLGNVWEWCGDWFGSYEGDVTDPGGPATGVGRVLRGGSWYDYARRCRSAYRGYRRPRSRYSNLGFRPARCLP